MRTPEVPFAGSALEVLALAREEADRLQHEYVGTEHVALALTRLREGPTATALDELARPVRRGGRRLAHDVARCPLSPHPGEATQGGNAAWWALGARPPGTFANCR